MSSLKEECGVVGVFNHPEAANLIYLSLYALQHRGQEACGLVSQHPETGFHVHKAFGLVGDAFSKKIIESLAGRSGIGHNRYSTQGGSTIQNVQPFFFNTAIGSIAIAHNGNITNAGILRKELEAQGSIFHSTSDTEVCMHLIAKAPSGTLLDRIQFMLQKIRGAYSLVILSQNNLFAVRDPFGFRPLVFGKKDNAAVFVSETCALDLIDADFEREVEPGELVEVGEGYIKSHRLLSAPRPTKSAFCAFEPIYFARPDSNIFGLPLYAVRKNLGTVLAQEAAVEADVVIAVPDSGVPMAMGFAEESHLPYEVGLVRNHYVGRTFIEPSQSIRDFGVKLKLNPVASVLKGRRIVVVDDSLVRGTTSVKILRMLRNAGAKEIHMRVASPPITHSCFYGVDTPKRGHLLAAQKNVQAMCDFIGADSLAFLSIDGLKKALGKNNENKFCYACFSGNYFEEIFSPIPEQPTDKTGPGLQYPTS